MSDKNYFAPKGGNLPQTDLTTGRAVFTDAYAVIPNGVMQDIVTSRLPFWEKTRAWVLARPMTGFAETFSQYIMEVEPGGGSDKPEPDGQAEGALFVVSGEMQITLEGSVHVLEPGAFVFIPPGSKWSMRNAGKAVSTFHWIRKRYQPVEGIALPEPIISNDKDVVPGAMPDTDGKWATTRFMEPEDMRYDMHVTIVTLEPGAAIPFTETHVMEHGLYVLEGKGVYRLNQDWVEVEAGDFMWLRAFCPQGCYAGGPGKFRYLLYKDVNRHMKLDL